MEVEFASNTPKESESIAKESENERDDCLVNFEELSRCLMKKLEEKEIELMNCQIEKEVLLKKVDCLQKQMGKQSGIYVDFSDEGNKANCFQLQSVNKMNSLFHEMQKWLPEIPFQAKYSKSLLLDMFFFMFSTGMSSRDISKTLLVNGLQVSHQSIISWMDLTMENLAKWGQSTVKWPTPDQWLADSRRIQEASHYSDYAQKLFFFVDGTIIKTFDTSDIRISQKMRNSKHGSPGFVFFIMVTPAGRVVYVSELREGTCHDKTHFMSDGVVALLEKEYPEPSVTLNGIKYQLVLGGDKAYPFAPLPSGWHWYITKTGEGSMDVDSEGKEVGERASSQKLKNVIFDPGFARLRSVVERTIGRIKGWAIFSSKHHLTSEQRVKWLILISIGLLNWDFEKGYLEKI